MVNKPCSMLLVPLLAAILSLSACGGGGTSTDTAGGGSPANPPGPAAVLAWEPPQTYDDSTPLDPSKDLAYYEIYMRSDPNFTEGDTEVAQVAAVESIPVADGGTRMVLTKEFDLASLSLTGGGTRYLAVRAVGVDGMKSDYSVPVAWTPGNV